MIVYAAQRQDMSEPWGWETDSLYHRQADALRRVEQMVRTEAEETVRLAQRAYEHRRAVWERDRDKPLLPVGVTVAFVDPATGYPQAISGREYPPPPKPPITFDEAVEDARHWHRVEPMVVW